MLRVSWWEKKSISGRVTDQRVYITLGGAKMYAVRCHTGSWAYKSGDTDLRHHFKKWCMEEFGHEQPPFDTIMERLKADKPKRQNPKTPDWLKK